MYVELQCKTNFSFLRGASDAKEYIRRAVQLGLPAIAINDVNGVYALPRAYEEVKLFKDQIKLISSAEVTVTDHSSITLIATTRKAYGLMCRILTQVHAGKEKGEGTITLSELQYLCDHFAGVKELICLAKAEKKTNFSFLKELFSDRLYISLCRYLDGLDLKRTAEALSAAKNYDLQIVAVNDVHYHALERRPLQDCMTSIREGVTVETAGFHLFGNEERYLKSDIQMRSLFSDLPQAITNTIQIADQCHFDLSEITYTYPHEFIPEGHTAKSYLRELVFKGAHEVYRGLITPQADAQIRKELAFFEKRQDEHYFLTVQDIVQYAKDNNILCQGRGSAANSIVCYVLGITSVDPIHMNLLFDRFMNEGRQEPPDIDVDFEHERREEVIQYIYRRFGRERAAMVCAVRTYRTKSSFLELSKAMGIEVGTMSAGELNERFDELAKEKKGRKQLVQQLSDQLKTFPRHLSIHSGGFVLSDSPLIEMVPVEPARMAGRTIIQWDKDDLETLRMMKLDILSIGFLTALHKATDLAKISWRDIPPDDQQTYKMIQKAETHGTFQIESRAQMNMLVQTLPQNYYDLVVEVALVRPSPTVGGMVQPFLKGVKQSRKGIPFKVGNAILEKILGRTHGVPIFQEQIMQISIEVGGFTPAEADHLRRSLGKQRTADSVDAMGKKLYQALIDNGVDVKFADGLFHYIKGYAHYGFPESHAASYASIAYKSAYMKCHYPAELLCGLINSQPMGFYSVDTLVNEAKRNGVQFLAVDPNQSDWDATMPQPKKIRMGFRTLKKARQEDVEHMIEARTEKPFTSIEDFIYRTHFNREVLENLSLANVFSCFGLDRRHSFWKSIEFMNICDKQSESQLTLFDEKTKLQAQGSLFSQMTLTEQIMTDYRKVGYSLEGNLMKALRLELPHLPTMTSAQIKKMPRDRQVSFAAILTIIQRPPPAQGTAFITFEDEFGSIDTVLKSATFEQFDQVIKKSKFLIIEGKIQRRGTGVSVLVSSVEAFSNTKQSKLNERGMHPRDMGLPTW